MIYLIGGLDLSVRIIWRSIYKPALLDLVLGVVLVFTADIVDAFIHLLNRSIVP